MHLSFLKIGTRLGLAFGLLVLMMLGITVVGVLRLAEVGVINERIIDDSWVKSEAASIIERQALGRSGSVQPAAAIEAPVERV